MQELLSCASLQKNSSFFVSAIEEWVCQPQRRPVYYSTDSRQSQLVLASIDSNLVWNGRASSPIPASCWCMAFLEKALISTATSSKLQNEANATHAHMPTSTPFTLKHASALA
eukprot:881691-Pelagomonas_calceolata.AAC.4